MPIFVKNEQKASKMKKIFKRLQFFLGGCIIKKILKRR